jgi:hypothetical protein
MRQLFLLRAQQYVFCRTLATVKSASYEKSEAVDSFSAAANVTSNSVGRDQLLSNALKTAAPLHCRK